MAEHIRLADYIDSLQSHGKYYFAKAEIINELKISEKALNASITRLIKKHRLVRPTKGFFVIVPTEYMDQGSPPASWFIDPLMKHLDRPYYVGVLTAAATHGAAHQRPFEFQVVTNKRMRTIHAGNNRIRFLFKRIIEKTSTETINTYTGTMHVSSPEETAFDLIRYLHAAGYLNNTATVLIELAEKIDSGKLLQAAKAGGEKAYIQRLGYLIDTYCEENVTGPMYEWLQSQTLKKVAIRPDRPIEGYPLNEKWRIIINETIEPDL